MRWFWAGVLAGASMLRIWAAGLPSEMWVVDPGRLNSAEQALLASLQGLANRDAARVWVMGPGFSRRIPDELAAAGVTLHRTGEVWPLVSRFRSAWDGYLLCSVTNASLNVATSLAGPRRALVLDASLRDKAVAAGIPEVMDVRSLDERAALDRFRPEFATGLVVHQPLRKTLHLRDYAVARRAFTFFDVSPAERSRMVAAFGPNTRAFGWGLDEEEFVREVSQGGGAVIPADWGLNLSALAHLPAVIPPRPRSPAPAPTRDGERVVAFVVTDGDNIQWLLNGFADSPGFWASPERGRFPVSWELAPSFAQVAPWALAHLFRTATPSDDFVAGPSGHGYYFPHHVPDRAAAARATAESFGPAQVNLVSLLNSGGGFNDTAEVLSHPEVHGVLYKDYAPYNRQGGAMAWFHGKPCVSYRYLLWELAGPGGVLRPDWLPEGVAEAVGGLPARADRDPDSYALINVHAWSFKDSGGPMGAIARTIALLPAGTRVVTATDFVTLLGRTR